MPVSNAPERYSAVWTSFTTFPRAHAKISTNCGSNTSCAGGYRKINRAGRRNGAQEVQSAPMKIQIDRSVVSYIKQVSEQALQP